MTAYEMRMSDWSSDVCSSDLAFLQFINCNSCICQESPPPVTSVRVGHARLRPLADAAGVIALEVLVGLVELVPHPGEHIEEGALLKGAGHRGDRGLAGVQDRKSTRLNSSH